MAEQRFQERIVFSGGKVDRSGPYPIIRDVLFCGPTSENGRDYLAEAFPPNVKLYEGKNVFVDHNHDDHPRKFREKLGWVENERRRPDGYPCGDIGVNPEHAEAKSFLWAAEHKPTFCGMSHDAYGDSRRDRNREQVYKITRVESLDVVIDPATTKGLLRESKGKPMTIQKLLEQIAAKSSVEQITKLRRLTEMEGMGSMEVSSPADATPEEAIDQAFESAMHSQVTAFIKGDIDFKAMLSKLKELAKAHGKVTGDEVEEGGEEESEGEGDSKKEGKKKKPATTTDGKPLLEALDIAGKIGFKADKTDLLIIAAQDPNVRESVARRLMDASGKSSGGGPTSTARGAGSYKESKSSGSQQQTESPSASWLD